MSLLFFSGAIIPSPCEDFLRAVAQGRTPDANIDDALINMQILEAVLASI